MKSFCGFHLGVSGFFRMFVFMEENPFSQWSLEHMDFLPWDAFFPAADFFLSSVLSSITEKMLYWVEIKWLTWSLKNNPALCLEKILVFCQNSFLHQQSHDQSPAVSPCLTDDQSCSFTSLCFSLPVEFVLVSSVQRIRTEQAFWDVSNLSFLMRKRHRSLYNHNHAVSIPEHELTLCVRRRRLYIWTRSEGHTTKCCHATTWNESRWTGEFSWKPASKSTK